MLTINKLLQIFSLLFQQQNPNHFQDVQLEVLIFWDYLPARFGFVMQFRPINAKRNLWMRLKKKLICFCSKARMHLYFLVYPLVHIWIGTWCLDIDELSCNHNNKIHTPGNVAGKEKEPILMTSFSSISALNWLWTSHSLRKNTCLINHCIWISGTFRQRQSNCYPRDLLVKWSSLLTFRNLDFLFCFILQ